MIFGRIPWSEQREYLLELRDDGAYLGTCSRGHEIAFALQSLRHEMLYEAGGVALVCGFNREAISTMATALERFYEFAIFVFAEHRGVSQADVEKAWKGIGGNSERQIGAFLFLYLTALGKPYAGIDQKMTALRNEVVHKGKIPTREQTLAFAEYVFNSIVTARAELKRHVEPALMTVQNRLLDQHMQNLVVRQQAEQARGQHRIRWHAGTMLRDWREPDEGGPPARGFRWNLEALAHRVKRAGLGLVVYPEQYSEFDPAEFEREPWNDDNGELQQPPAAEDLDDGDSPDRN